MVYLFVFVVFLSCLAILPREVVSFRTPIVFPAMDVSKYVYPKIEADAVPIAAYDESVPEVNHEHPDDDLMGEPVAHAQKSIVLQRPPEDTMAVWDDDGAICILAKFQMFVTIPYQTATGREYSNVKMPSNKEITKSGNCATTDQDSKLVVEWPLFKFILQFSSSDDANSWFVSKMELYYNTNSPDFPGALNQGSRYANTENITLFLTPMGQSYGCPLHPPLGLQIQNSTQRIMVKLKDIRLQAHQDQGEYGPLFRCPQVALEHSFDPYNYDKTVPVVAGTIALILIVGATLGIAGYVVNRFVLKRKVDLDKVQHKEEAKGELEQLLQDDTESTPRKE